VPFEIYYTPTAIRHLRDFSARDRSVIMDVVDEQLRHQPGVPTRHRKQLRTNPVAPWELRVGDFRVFYDLEPGDDATSESKVVLLAVGVKVRNRIMIGGEEHEL
jgi:mRNA-degrading endonuclease RelE of RelBE toxin-antitoxin system